MKAIARVLRRVLRWTVFAAAAAAAVIFLINGYDQQLTPQTLRLLQAPPNPYQASVNLYLALAGIHAPSGQSVTAFGEKRVRTYEAELTKGPWGSIRHSDSPVPGELKFRGNLTFCRAPSESIWDAVDGHKTKIKQLLSVNREMYQRYLALHSTRGFYVTATPSLDAPLVYAPTQLRCLFLARFALRMKSRDLAAETQALTDMSDDIQVWHMQLTGYGSLISKLMAVANLRSDFLVIGYMIADRHTDLSQFRTQMNRLVTPFPINDWKTGTALGYEFRQTALYLRDLDLAGSGLQEPPSLWEKLQQKWLLHFYQKNATTNLEAKNMEKYIELADGPPASLDKPFQTSGTDGLRLGWVYNPAGKMLVTLDSIVYSPLPLRTYDVAALQRMVKLAYEIRVHRIGPREIPSLMHQHPEWATHPVDGKEFNFNLATGGLSFKPVSPCRKDIQFSLPIWRPLS